jgi:hypothetical protein
MRPRMTWPVCTVLALALTVVVGVACSGSGGASSGAAPIAERAGGKAGPAASGPPVGAVGTALDLSVSQVGPKIVKTASVRIEIADDTFDERSQQAVQIAARHGGFVVSSQTAGAERRTGTLVIRVPSDQFEAALGEVKGVGRVKSETVAGQDVTSQYVDLQARLRNWESQETVLLGLMSKATTIDESIKVQRALQDVQLAIEELRGQLHVLDDQTSYSTITATIAETGAAQPKPEGTIARAWGSAKDGFVGMVGAAIVGIGYLAPVALALLVGSFVWRGVRKRVRPVPTPSGG